MRIHVVGGGNIGGYLGDRLAPAGRGVTFLVLSLLIFSLQDIAIKWIGGDYPVSEIVLFRSIVALPAALLFVRAIVAQIVHYPTPVKFRQSAQYI